MRPLELIGQRFGRLVVLRRGPSGSAGVKWFCMCDCGQETLVYGYRIKCGHTSSCGCLCREVTSNRMIKHGMSGLISYKAWYSAKRRCYNRADSRYKDYGGRGIRMCKRWRSSFEAFVEDMGDCPPGLTLERIDNDGDYEPGNCKWATRKEQYRNRRTNVWVKIGKKKLIQKDWAKKLGVSVCKLRTRLKKEKATKLMWRAA